MTNKNSVSKKWQDATITPTFKIPINFEMFQAYTKFLKNIFGFIVDGVILMLKSAEKQKIWLEFFYKDYAHGKFLISEKDFELLAEETMTDFLKNRLNENRQEILKNPQMLKKYISPKIMVRTEDIFNQINLESENFQSAMKNFEQEEMKYFENHQE